MYTPVRSAGLVLLAASGLAAQAPTADSARPARLARFVPADVGLYVEIDPLADFEQQLATVPRAIVLSLLGATPTEHLVCASAIGAHLGLPLDAQLGVLFSGRVALAASDWANFADAVVLIEVSDTTAFDRFFEIDRKAPVPVHDGPRSVRSARGVWLALGKRWAAFSRRPAEESPLFVSIAESLAAPRRDGLAARAEFRALWEQLPREATARLYVDGPRSGGATDLLLANVERCAIGLTLPTRPQQPGGRPPEAAELHVRAEVGRSLSPLSQRPVAAGRVLDLPQSTLLAWATSFDAKALIPSAAETSSSGLAATVGGLAARLLADDAAPAWLAGLGPRAILVWGRTQLQQSAVPQLAVLVEASVAAESAAGLAAQAEAWIPLLSAMQSAGTAATLAVHHEEYLGTELWSIPLGTLVAPPEGTSGPLDWLTSVAPSFAALDDWLVVTLSPEHLKQIIDASRGVIPTLRAMSDVARLDRGALGEKVYARIQPGLIAQVLDGWLADHADGRPSILDSQWWSGANVGSPLQIGIGIDRRFESGRVVIARIHEGLPADGRLRVGDRVIGVDGRLLSLAAPNDDFRRHVQSPEERSKLTLRVLRDDALLDIDIPVVPALRPSSDPLDALRRAATLLAGVRQATYVVAATGEHQMSARLTLVFAP